MSTQLTLTAVPFIPSSPLTGGESLSVYRGQNMKMRGLDGRLFYEVYAGSENLNEPIPASAITGTLAFSPASTTVTGTGTAFLTQLHIGQLLLANTEVLAVAEIFSDTSFRTGRPPVSTETTTTATRLPVLFALDINRGSLLTGNALHFDKGTILCVGSGTLRVNGSVLAGDSLTAARRAQVALYDSSTMTYDVQDIGFDEVPTITNSDVSIVTSGGVKNMSPGYYSFRVGYYSTVTTGYGNTTDTLLASDVDGYHITAANSTISFDFSGDTPPAKADGYILYGSAFAGSSDISKVNAIQGGWFEFQRVPFTELSGGSIAVEYVDADLTTLVSFDNDTPPDAEYYGSLDRYPVLISTNGAGVGSGARRTSTSPGPYVSPIKAENFDAYPSTYKVPTEKGETILGVVSAAGRIFVLTPNTLQAVTPTGLPAAPMTCRPFWKRGFQGPYNLAFIDDTLYGFTSAGMFRSIATGDEGSESHVFASDVEAQTATWHGGYVFVEHDAKNEEVCFIYSASSQNDNGYWESIIYPYSLRQNNWQPAVLLSDPTRDMIVSGAAAVNGHLEFIAGGRRAATTNQHDTWRYDMGSGQDVPWYLAFNYMDNGSEIIAKTIRKMRPKGKFTDAKMQLYVTTPDTDVDITDLETGTNPTFEKELDDSTEIKQYDITKCRARNAMMWTARLEGTSNWDGSSVKDQFHELAITLDVSGQQR